VSHLLICGAAGYTNAGDDAILWGMLVQLQQAVGRRLFRVAGGPRLAKLVEPLGATPVSYEDRSELARAIEDADLVVLGGGGLLYDSGYDASLARLLGDPPDHQWLYEMARVSAAAAAAGRPAMLYGLGAGPLVTGAARGVARFIAEHAASISLRDEASVDVLAECGVPRTRLHLAADPAVTVDAGEGEAPVEQIDLSGRPRPWVAVNLRPWGEPAQAERLIVNGAALVRGVRERLGGTPVLLALQRVNDDDAALLGEVRRRSGVDAVLVDRPPSPPDLVGLLAAVDLVVGMRLHSLILSLNGGTPFVALSYDPKVEEFARAAGLAEYAHSVDRFDAAAVLDSCAAVLAAQEEMAPRLAARREALRASAGLSVELAKELLECGRPRHRVAIVSGARARAADRIDVLMQIRPDYLARPGGDTTQMNETKRHLELLGVKVSVSTDETPDVSSYDVVHAFNLGRPQEPHRHCLNAVQQGKPAVVSTVYWDFGEFWEWGDPDYWRLPPPEEGPPEPRRAPPPDPIERRRRARLDRLREAAIACASVFLPNGQGEADLLHEAYGMDLSRTVVVPNAVDDAFFEARHEAFVEKHGLRDFVLCAARVEKRKNQLLLAAALRGTGVPLVIAGQPNPEQYRELCRRYADDSVVFLGALAQDELAGAYAAAKVHALPGWFETPGLSTLEAAAAGCNIVTTDRGLAREYLGDSAWYCDPRSVESIREAVLAAYEAPRSEALRERVRERYTWERTAEQTLAGYRLALALCEAQPDSQHAEAAVSAMREHADYLARLAADREYEARRMREWAETVDAELRRLQQEFEQVTSRRLHRWSAAAAKAGWGILRALGVGR